MKESGEGDGLGEERMGLGEGEERAGLRRGQGGDSWRPPPSPCVGSSLTIQQRDPGGPAHLPIGLGGILGGLRT